MQQPISDTIPTITLCITIVGMLQDMLIESPPPPAYGSKGRRDLTLSRLLVGESIRAPAAASVENNQCVQPDSSSVAPVRPPVAALSAVVLSSTIFK